MTVATRSQRLAQAAFGRVMSHRPLDKEYVSFAKKFPALIHTCGLAQAVAFALAKGSQCGRYAADLARVLNTGGHDEVTSAEKLAERTREELIGGYLRLSRDAIAAAVWLKRYVEAATAELIKEGVK